MTDPVWVDRDALIELHADTITNEGGLPGIRDEGLLDSALARPRNAWSYGVTSVPMLAASYAFGLAKNHPFQDGNKRAAFLAATVFLELNGYRFVADEAEATQIFFALAGGSVREEELSDWLALNVQRA